MAVKPTGSLVVAGSALGIPVGTPEFCLPGCGNEKYLYSAFETLLRVNEKNELVSAVAQSWQWSPDYKAITWKIRPGIQFHGGWGEVTADDIAFSFNTINGATNPNSKHDNVGDFAAFLGTTDVVDKYTVKMNMTKFDSRQPIYQFSTYWQGAAIESKAVYDKFGAEGMRDKFFGTGPFQIKSWVQNDHILLDALDSHWRKTASVKTVRINYVPEVNARVAMFETGEALITRLPLKDTARLMKKNGVTVDRGAGQTGIFMAGNYFEKTGARSGKPLDQPGFDPSLPWVSNPNGPGCTFEMLTVAVPTTTCDSLEKGRKVRTALMMAIDRQAINNAIYVGMGKPAYVDPVDMDSPNFNKAWIVPFDPAGAKKLLTEAGFPNGFKAEMYVGDSPENQELGEAIAGDWLRHLNVSVEFDRSQYAVIRPTYVTRANKKLALDAGAGGYTGEPLDWPRGQEDNSWFEGGTMKAGSIPFSAYTYGTMMSESDKEKRLKLAIDWLGHQSYWKWHPRVIQTPTLDIYNGDKVKSWLIEPTTIWWAASTPWPLENIVLK
jgi:ABC-type transport system substrate-binding protein